MKVQHIIGADLSKNFIDLHCHGLQTHLKIQNCPAGFTQMLGWIKSQGIGRQQVMVVMEHTGLYSYLWEGFLHTHHICFTKVAALAIKRSMGMVRGKNDYIDAQRIARYGYDRREELSQAPKANKILDRLGLLYATRQRLVRHRAALMCALKQYQVLDLKQSDPVIKAQQQILNQFSLQIERLQREMDLLMEKEQSIHDNYNLLRSIKGVGKVLAMATIIKTGNFTLFTNARKFACYCGTAPFEHSSGSSIRKKTRVSHLADKTMKTLLDLAAKSAIQYDGELKDYYEKRTQLGKAKMSTINVVRNKLIYRMFAIIKRGTPFIETYLQVA